MDSHLGSLSTQPFLSEGSVSHGLFDICGADIGERTDYSTIIWGSTAGLRVAQLDRKAQVALSVGVTKFTWWRSGAGTTGERT
jgi:hypothetical protein